MYRWAKIKNSILNIEFNPDEDQYLINKYQVAVLNNEKIFAVENYFEYKLDFYSFNMATY